MTRLKSAAPVAAEVVNVTPTLAAEWLSANKKNRNLSQSSVEVYARDMREGDWRFTGEAIKFDGRGHLVDGQHRLMAVIRAGATVPMLVVKGLDPESQNYMDSGKKRTAADMLSLNGHANSNILASAARFGIIVESGQRMAGQIVSKAQVADYVDANPDLRDAASHASGLRRYLPFSPTALTYAWMLLTRVDPTDAAAFFDALANNATRGKGDPRNTLLRRMNAARRADERLSTESQVQFIVRAWNAHRQGRDLSVLKVRTGTGGGNTVAVSIPKAI